MGIDQASHRSFQFENAGTLPKFGFAILQKQLFLEASYKVAYLIAKQRKSHAIGETSEKPRALEMVELVCIPEQRKKNWNQFHW